MVVLFQGTHPTWNFVIYFSRPGICSKVGKTWNVNSQPGKNFKLVNLVFQDIHFKMSFTKIIIYIFVISTLSTQTLIRSQIDLGFYCFCLEITWKIHGISCHQGTLYTLNEKNPYILMWSDSGMSKSWINSCD